jgi:nucleoside phosphorylase
VKAASAAKKLLEDFRPPYVLLVGIAGGVMGRDGTGIADVIVPNFIDYYEIRKLHAGRSLRRVEPHDHPGCSMLNYFALPVARKKEWVTKIDPTRRPGQDGNLPQFRSGYLISGEKVLGDDEAIIQQHLLKEFDNAVAVDMESFGVAEAIFSTRVTRHYNPQFLVVRGISDLIEETNKIPPLKALANSLIGRLRSGLISHSSHGRAEIMQDNNATRKKWKPYAAHAAAVFAAAVIERLLETTRSTSATTNSIE